MSTRLVTHLGELVGVGADLRQVAVDLEARSRGRCRPATDGDDALDRGLEVERPRVEREPAGVDAGHVEQLGDQPGQPVGVGVDRLEHQLLLVVVELVPLGQQRRDEALDAGQRRAQLVGDGRDQVGRARGRARSRAGPSAATTRHLLHRAAGRSRQMRAVDQQLGAVGEVPRLLGEAGRACAGRRRASVRRPVVAGPVLERRRRRARVRRPVGRARSSRRAAALTTVTMPAASAMTTPSGSASSSDCRRLGSAGRASSPSAMPSSVGSIDVRHGHGLAGRRVTVRGRALGPGRGVEADGGRGGEVEALGAAVDRDPHPVVGQRGDLGGQPPGLVAEQPGGRAGEQAVVGSASSRSTSPAPSAASTVRPAARSAATAAAASATPARPAGGTG